MKMDENIIAKLLLGAFAVIGAGFLIAATAYGITSKQKQSQMELTYAVITEIYEDDEGGDVYVDYEYGGTECHNKRLGYYSSSMRVGDFVDIYVDPSNPDYFKAKGQRTVLLIVFYAIGGVFFLIGGSGVFYFVRKKMKNKRLFREGKRVTGIIEKIEQNKLVTVNEAHPYYATVVVRDEFSGAETFYKSDNFWDDVYETINVGDSAVVYIDRNDEKKYFVDVTGANSIMGSSMSELF